MEHFKQKKKPAAKLEQIIIPDKEKSSPAKADTVCTGIESSAKCNATGVSGTQQVNTQQVSIELVSPESAPIVKQLKKRGRKRKIPIDVKYTNPDYIVMWPEICMAQKVLVDRYDNVYTYDLNSPLWLGVKTPFGKIDNTTHNAPLTKYYFQ